MDIYEFLLSRPDVFPKRNPLIFPKLDAEGREVVPPFVSLARVLALAAPADMLPPAAVDGRQAHDAPERVDPPLD